MPSIIEAGDHSSGSGKIAKDARTAAELKIEWIEDDMRLRASAAFVGWVELE